MRTLRRLLPALLALGTTALVIPARAQLAMGQYETEAPSGSWNSFPFLTAPSLGRGETVYAFASLPSAALSNPALAARLPKLSLGLNGSLRRAEFFRFGPLNTGAFSSRDNLTVDLTALDWGGVSLKLGRWAVAFNAALLEDYDRPIVDFDYYEGGRLLYSYRWAQKGILRIFHLALARDLRSNLSIGLGVGLLSGTTELDAEENYIYAGYSLRDNRDRDLSGFFLNAGLVWDPWPALRLGLAVRAPFIEKAESTSDLSFASAGAGSSIIISDSTVDKSRLPAAVGAGACWTALPGLQLTLDLTFLNWASYQSVYFGETKTRPFRNVIKIGAGVEYAPEIELWGAIWKFPLRAGFVYDPQPMKNPRSGYRRWTIGVGAALKRVSIDIGASFGTEDGSGRSLRTARAAAALGISL